MPSHAQIYRRHFGTYRRCGNKHQPETDTLKEYHIPNNFIFIAVDIFSYTMKNFPAFFVALLLLSGCKKQFLGPLSTPWSISNGVLGHRLTITCSPKFAGAIYSLNWNGKEFLNAADHGRELQSAVTFDGFGECFNPTEAGSAADATADTSTSRLLSFSTDSTLIKSSAQMAFWTGVGQGYPAGCGITNIDVAQNTTNLSSDILTKRVTIGFSGISNAIAYQVTFHVAEHHSSAIFESLTGYLTQDFSAFWTFDPATGSLAQLSYGPGEQDKPIIFSTPAKNFAMGIYSPGLPEESFPGLGYGRYSYLTQFTTKWSAFYHMGDTPAGDYTFQLYVVIGSLTQVAEGMTSVYKTLHP